ncbi:uncharacterized protein LOC116348546 [Contarinia nasturtii]|uniref:uncharacterized protein LOC116348546 n=1 Tax=Contarinia nasturtii TaxID=265458 RepID=UPI0012D3C71D|nr:uncharacterized protein LOC116348546 [Contarinia nasturtii]
MIGVKFDEESKLWSSTEEPKYLDPNLCFGTFLLDTLSKHGSKVAQINHDTGVKMTYDELRLKTIRAAQNLQKKGFQYKDVFAFLAVNSDDLCPIVFASFCMGCTINPLHSSLSKEEIAQKLKKTNTKSIFCDVDSYNLFCEALNESQLNVPIFTFDGQISTSEPVESLLIQTGNEHEFVPVRVEIPSDIAGFISSSGTTGPSKCVVIPYSMFYFTIPPKDDICLCFSSIYWTTWMYYVLTCTMKGSTRIITRYSFSAALQFEIIEKHKVTLLWTIPCNMVACLKSELIRKSDLSSVQQIRAIGGKASSGIITETYHYYPNAAITSPYGLTEVGGVFEFVLDKNGNHNAGVLYNGVTMKIVDDNGNRCGANVDGEICTKTKYKFIEYLNDSKATAAAFDSEGFFLTGDIGHFDENETLHITDRKKDIFRIFYFRAPFSTSEIESYLIKIADIQEVCIFGITTGADEKLPAAVIVRNSNSSLNERKCYELVAHHFPKREWLRGGVYFVDSLPKTPSGKIIRRKVAELATEIFHKRGINDPDIQSYIADIPEEYHKLIARNNTLSKHGSKVAQINHDTGVRMTYDELRLKAIRAAQNLQKKGFQYKDLFTFLAVNSDNLCPIVFASSSMGCPINPLHSSLSKEEIAQKFKKTNTKAIFCDVDSYNLICEALNESQLKVPIFTFDGQISTSEPVESLLIQTGNEHEFVPVHVDMLNDIAAILSSSGTTGPSKCISMPYAMINLPDIGGLYKDDICLSFSAIYWGSWLLNVMSSSMKGSTRIITKYCFSAALQFEIIEKHNVTFLLTAPTQMIACLKNDLIRTTDLSSVQEILVIGGKASSGIVIETYRYYPNAEIIAGYSLTEIGTNFLWVLNKNGKYSAGVLYNGMTMKIVDDHGNRCGANVDGEICTKTKYKFIEYLNDPKATAAAFDNEGFFLTGDIGHFDENGALHITDRKKDIFRIFYFIASFSPFEMESYLITLPDVQEVCIVGITTGVDEKLPAAVIVRSANSSLIERDFFELVANHFPKRMWLRGGVYFVDSLPKTPSGKVIRRKVAELATELFHLRGINDLDIQSYIADIPEEYHKLIARNIDI